MTRKRLFTILSKWMQYAGFAGSVRNACFLTVASLLSCYQLVQSGSYSRAAASITSILGKDFGYSQFQFANYGDSSIRQRDEGYAIYGGNGPSGLFIRRKLSGSIVYRIVIKGNVEESPVTLRVRADDAEPEYASLSATGGDIEFEISHTRWIELLIYSDHPFRYLLTTLAVEPCATCTEQQALDASLRHRILTAIPALTSALKEDRLRAAALLTNWASQSVVQGDPSGPVQRNTNLIEIMHAGWIQEHLWDKEAGGTYCQGFATFLDKVFSLFGIPSFVVTVGYPGTDLTHVVNVVAIADGGKRHYYLFDPTFNGTLADQRSGHIADLEAFLESRRNPGSSAVEPTFATWPIARDVVLPESALASFLTALAHSNSRAECAAPPDPSGFVTCRNFTFGLAYYRTAFATQLVQHRIDPNHVIEALLLHGVISSTRFDSPDDAQQFYTLLARYGVSH